MEKYPFMKHRVKRTCKEKLSSYKEYRPFLEKDFSGHCCYCNMIFSLSNESFHIDHFIPKAVFKGKKDSLLDDYNNLMWSCPKCNMSKGRSYEGKIESDDSITNELFYNPVDVDYNSIFYRNSMGAIQSDDEKGKSMIKKLGLYRPVHSYAWILEEYDNVIHILEEKMKHETDEEKKSRIEKALGIVSYERVKLQKNFNLIYIGKPLPNNEE